MEYPQSKFSIRLSRSVLFSTHFRKTLYSTKRGANHGSYTQQYKLGQSYTGAPIFIQRVNHSQHYGTQYLSSTTHSVEISKIYSHYSFTFHKNYVKSKNSVLNYTVSNFTKFFQVRIKFLYFHTVYFYFRWSIHQYLIDPRLTITMVNNKLVPVVSLKSFYSLLISKYAIL